MVENKENSAEKPQRIAKVIARAGVCSRRDAERYIADGRVTLNGKVLTSPACTVGANDAICVDGKPLPVKEQTRVWRYHKPAGLVVSHKDEKGRKTVFDALPDTLPRVVSVGRLDLNSEGLLLLTNDGAFARQMEMPSSNWVRRYRVRIHGKITPEQIASLNTGVEAEGVKYKGVQVVVDKDQGSNQWLTVSLTEGKNREIRRLMDYLGFAVTRLIRVSYGPFQLGKLEVGAADEISGKMLKEQIGGKFAFDAAPKHAFAKKKKEN